MYQKIKLLLLKVYTKYQINKRGITLILNNSILTHTLFSKSTKNNNQVIKVLPNSTIQYCDFILRGKNSFISIGNNSNIHNVQFWIEDTNNSIIIGNEVTIEGGHFAVTGHNKKITIGNDCMISNNVTIRTGDSHAILQNGIKINNEKDVIIGNNVWIGNNVIILKGGHVGEGAIIGAGSVVTSDIEANTIYAGNPARIIKSNISWTRKRFIE